MRFGAREERATSSGATLIAVPSDLAVAACAPWSSSSAMPLDDPSEGSSIKRSLKGFCWAKVVKPFSPTAGVVVTVKVSPVTVFFDLAATLMVEPPPVTLVTVVPFGNAPPESVTGSLAKMSDVLPEVTVIAFCFLVMLPVIVTVMRRRQAWSRHH